MESCHSSLIRLGDLSRYRETELVPKPSDRKWDQAILFYDLAGILNPDSGVSHNQLAVIGLADGNHLRATYHLYRALSAIVPHPTANGNLGIEFRKILVAWTKGELLSNSKDSNASLISLFIYFHAQCFKGADFPEHDGIEIEILSQIAVNIKEQSLEPALLHKFCLINIAAEDYARRRAQFGENMGNAQYSFQRMNVKVFFTLLRLLFAEIESSVSSESEKITPVTKCVLPVLRQYSSWLLSNSDKLTSETKDTQLYVQIKELWKLYASTLSLLIVTFEVAELPDVNYLLHEDEEILGFNPLINSMTVRRYLDEKGTRKPRSSDVSKRGDAKIEMLYRIREIVLDGLDLVINKV